MLVAPATTWLLVSTVPEELMTMPVPAASPPANPSRVVMSTTPGSTLAAMVPVSAAPLLPCEDGGAEPSGEPVGWIENRPTPTPMAATRTTATATAITRSGLLRGGGDWGGSQIGGAPQWPGAPHRLPPSHGCDDPGVAHPPGGTSPPDPPALSPAGGPAHMPGWPAGGGGDPAGYEEAGNPGGGG